MSKKLLSGIILYLLVILTSALIISQKIPNFYSRQNLEISSSPNSTIADNSPIEENSFGAPELHSSPNKQYSYLLKPIANSQNRCDLTIFGQNTPLGNDYIFDTESLLGFSDVSCSSSMGFSESDVRGWLGNDILSIYRLDENKKPQIISFDLTKNKVYKYQLQNNLVLYAHSADLSSFIFADNSTNTYYLSNGNESQMKTVDTSKIFSDGWSLKKIIFDPFNDTFMFITQKQFEINNSLYPGYVKLQISTVNNKHLDPKIIYTSPNIEIFHPMDTGIDLIPVGKNKIAVSRLVKRNSENPNGDKTVSLLIN